MKNDTLRNQKAKNLSVRMIALIASLALSLLGIILSLVLYKNDNAAIFILFVLGVGACSLLFSIAIFYFIFTFLHKNKGYALIAYVSASIATCLLLAILNVIWYIILIVFIFLAVVFWLLSVTLYSKKLTLVFDNEQPDYKNYQQRQAEKQAEEANKQPEELPEIKSFKD